jgi:Flp pilus assembly protein TadD
MKALLACAVLAGAGCTAGASDIQVRALADPAAKLGTGNARIAEARAQLALGNVALALEGFRKAVREQPGSVAAYSGMAACYDAMGRYDLSRVNYEAALALAPNDAPLLTTFALSLETQGKRTEAAAVRQEVARLASASDALDRPDLSETVAVAESMVAAGPSVTVALPPARPVEAAAPAAMLSAPALAQTSVALGATEGPRLERLSPGVVALITTDEPVWQSKVVAHTAQSTTVRWVPLASASSRARPNIRLLNAARFQGLAARTRGYLHDRGWRRIEIGDADQVRDRSIVFYPASRRTTGRSLAAQFGFASAVREGDSLVVLLGRDAAGLKAVQTHG